MKGSVQEFISEAEELIEDVNKNLLTMQDTFKQGIDPDVINSIFRSIHTLKGLSGLFGLRHITEFSHSLESFLDELRLGKVTLDSEVIGFLFSNIDILMRLFSDVEKGEKEGDVSGAIRDIEAFKGRVQGKVSGPSLEELGIDPTVVKVLSEYEEHRLKTNITDGKGIYQVQAIFGLTDFDKALEGLTNNIKAMGEVITTLPSSTGIPPGSIGFTIIFGSKERSDAFKDKLSGFEIKEIVQGKLSKPAAPSTTQDTATLKSITHTVRVDIDKLDRILNTVGELVLAKGAVHRISKEMSDSYGYTPLVIDVHKIAQTFERRLAELQDQILEIRMVPIGQIFGRLAQVVRRYTRDVGKEIDLELFGEDTEIDKLLAEEIIDPLMHLIRNAIDHGIEPADVRKASGKKEKGTVTLRAFPKGNRVVIDVQDDGAGIDMEKLVQKAKEKGLVSPGQSLERSEIIDLIFIPGFSTKDVVSEVSGRGVGMDVVKEKLSSLGGFIEVHTVSGQGTTFTLTLPITLAIIKALLIGVSTERFAIPLTSIAETLIIQADDIQTIEGKEVLELRGEMLSLLRVANVFRLEIRQSDRFFIVVVGFGERRMGMIVDEIYGQQEIVIKSLSDYLKGIPGLAGAAEIGKHEVILVLDVEALLEDAVQKKRLREDYKRK